MLYLACVNDRHRDPEFKLFKDQWDAEQWAGATFRGTVAHSDGVTTEPGLHPYLVFWYYAYEQDHAWVMEIEVTE
jgi:hypothetical protein